MELEGLLRSYFGTDDLESLCPDALAAAIERVEVGFGTATEPGRRFALWTLLHSFGSAPDPATAFEDAGDRKAAEDYAWAAERIARREEGGV